MGELAVASADAPQFDAAFRNGFAELLAWRRDVRHFRPGEAPDEAMLAELFDLAALAPSVGNCQPTRFVRVDNEARRAAVRANFEAANREALDAYRGDRAALYANLKLAGLRDSPVQVAVFCDEATEQGHGLGARTMPEARRYSTVCALHTLWLAARARPWRRLGLDPRSRRNRRGARRPARMGFHRLSLRRLAEGGASHPGARARRLAGARAASDPSAVGRARSEVTCAATDEGRRPIDSLRVRLHIRQIEIDDDGLLAAAHQNA